jgi:Asp-tRNA(Asn)/Glu-tRNA(Gln) amidotransferase A subunit family amidase
MKLSYFIVKQLTFHSKFFVVKKISFLACLLLALQTFAQDTLSINDLPAAERIAGLRFKQAERDSLFDDVKNTLNIFGKMHQQKLDNSVPLSSWQTPVLPGMQFNKKQLAVNWTLPANVAIPTNKNELAFYSLLQLASLLKNKKISSVELTKFFIERLKKYGDTLQCVISVTEDLALQQAAQADKEIAAGKYRGVLHGIPYGLKDLFAVKGTKTTWGAAPYKNQTIDEDAFVYTQLKNAGAVLIAKFTLGALAMGDYWYGGRTKNPWNLKRGSSGSSAGSTAATVAGLVPFAIGTETWGSIISPSANCRATGLRPTFGSVSRSGAMALSYSLDKVGPICRNAEDAAIVFHCIHGTDGKDQAAVNMPFNYTGKADLSKLKIAYAKHYFDMGDTLGNEFKVLETYKKLGVQLIPVDFPDSTVYPFDMMNIIISAECAAQFDEFTRSELDDMMTRQGKNDWPNQFRSARFIPAVEYINAYRHRYLLMQKVNAVLKNYDVFICPTYGGNQVAITNLTGHPALCFPTGFNKNGLPTNITLVGNLYSEATLLAVAKAFQDATDFEEQHPAIFK